MSLVDLAHITDVHLGPVPRAHLGELMSKRALGYLSWHRRRHLLHRQSVLDALALDLAADPPDHIAVTGDLVNLALPGEFEQAARWLAATGTSAEVTLVPGNHDAYTGKSYRQGWARWSAYMQGDGQAASGVFPFVREIAPGLALIGVSSAVPSPIGYASGRIGPAQLLALDGVLAELGDAGLFRVVMIHHPPLGPLIRRRRALEDELALRVVLAKRGCELILAGHQHSFLLGTLPGPTTPVPVVAGPSASLVQSHPEAGGYLRYAIDLAGDRPSITVQLRRFDPASSGLVIELTGVLETAGETLAIRPTNWPKSKREIASAEALGARA
jgi:3',5'-cyclic AMP phosphodiesterase CpdA